MSSRLDPFYPILDSAEWLQRLVPLGIKLVQLRVKDQSADIVREEILKSLKVCQQFQCQLVVNDYWQLAIETGADFIHLGQEDLEVADVGAIRSAGLQLGISSHSEDELETALAVQPDYIALGPVYPTILKKMPWQPQGLTRVQEWKQKIGDIPLVGIGGLNLERAEGVFKAGADCVAMVTDITLNTDPEAQTRRWIEITQPFRDSNYH
ncbi:MAG: thiamine phosphate synthase [Pseudomonadota bacterium]